MRFFEKYYCSLYKRRWRSLRLTKIRIVVWYSVYSVWYICFSFEVYNILILNCDKKVYSEYCLNMWEDLRNKNFIEIKIVCIQGH